MSLTEFWCMSMFGRKLVSRILEVVFTVSFEWNLPNMQSTNTGRSLTHSEQALENGNQ